MWSYQHHLFQFSVIELYCSKRSHHSQGVIRMRTTQGRSYRPSVPWLNPGPLYWSNTALSTFPFSLLIGSSTSLLLSSIRWIKRVIIESIPYPTILRFRRRSRRGRQEWNTACATHHPHEGRSESPTPGRTGILASVRKTARDGRAGTTGVSGRGIYREPPRDGWALKVTGLGVDNW